MLLLQRCFSTFSRIVAEGPASPLHTPRTTAAASASAKTKLLSQYLSDRIRLRGPLNIATFQRECLINPIAGYYSNPTPSSTPSEKDEKEKEEEASSDIGVFGRSGDFITAPEISQLFGEIIGVWCTLVTSLHTQFADSEDTSTTSAAAAYGRGDGKKKLSSLMPSSLSLIEAGPGRGTLMADLLRGLKPVARGKFFDLFSKNLALVEASHELRELQKLALKPFGCEPKWFHDLHALSEADGKGGGKKEEETTEGGGGGGVKEVMERENNMETTAAATTTTTTSTNEVKEKKPLPVILGDGPVLFVAQEYFDCLGVHQFEYSTKGHWCEFLIGEKGSAAKEEGAEWAETATAEATMPSSSPPETTTELEGERDSPFAWFLSPSPTIAARAALYMHPHPAAADPKPGDRVEISLTGMAAAEFLGRSIGARGGAALIVDYGKNGYYANSLQGIYSHRRVSPLHLPGLVDVSHSVDFERLACAARNASEDVEVLGPIPQGEFLRRLGIEMRLEKLMETCSSEQAQLLLDQYRRLTFSEDEGNGEEEKKKNEEEIGESGKNDVGMGQSYMVLAIVHKSLLQAGLADLFAM